MKKLGFVVAMEKEAKHILNNSEIYKNYILSSKKIYEGNFQGKDFVLVISGIGKVNAGMSTQLLLDNFNTSSIINFGLAGGKEGSNLQAGDIVQVKSVCQYDFDLSEIDDVEIGYMQDYDTIYYKTQYKENLQNKYKLVKCASGDRFTAKIEFLNIIKNLKAEIVDMECGAIGQVCFANNSPLYILKLISDVDGKNESIFEQYSTSSSYICENILTAISELISEL